jgi:hypothetical protein
MNAFKKIAMHYLPKGYTVDYRKSPSGRHYGKPTLIQAPRPVTAKSLYIFLHECAHAYLHDGTSRTPRHVEEMEAELWAHAKMEKHDIPVPPEITVRARKYVARKIMQAEPRPGLRVAIRKGFRKKWAASGQEGGRTGNAKRWTPIGCSMSISWQRKAASAPAGPVRASGPTATRLLQLTSVLRLRTASLLSRAGRR